MVKEQKKTSSTAAELRRQAEQRLFVKTAGRKPDLSKVEKPRHDLS